MGIDAPSLTDVDAFMGFILIVAFITILVASWNVFQILALYVFNWRSHRQLAKWRRQDEIARNRRRREAYGDTLIDEIGEAWGGKR